jgi:prepilin-type N-terminal cleavage/methylation domain-containing protein
MMKDNGFTLIEMTFSLMLIGVAAGAVMPPLVQWQRNAALASSTDQIERMHELTRITAMREGRIAELHVDGANTRAWIEVDTSGTGVRDTVAMLQELDPDVAFTANRAVLCFDARGLPTTEGACDAPDATIVVSLGSNGQVDTTNITLLGKVIR